MKFRVGTIEGAWRATKKSYEILSIINSNPGNGHLTDVLEWFGSSCKRDKKSLVILELWNDGFKKHLIEKTGFKVKGKDNLEKKFI